MKEVISVYDWVYVQVSMGVRTLPVREAYKVFMREVESVGELLDIVILKGRPEGRCRLCPGVSISDSTGQD